MNVSQAKKTIELIFSAYRTLTSADRNQIDILTEGKLYELWVLSRLIEEINSWGYKITFKGSVLKFKGAPGHLKTSDPHFIVNGPGLPPDECRVFVDVEFTTLSATKQSGGPLDRSAHYEADIIVTTSTRPRPRPEEIMIVIECKAHANLAKGVIREMLGTRRELSLLCDLHPCPLPNIANHYAQSFVRAYPPIDLRLVTTDPNALLYRDGPEFFGIKIESACP